jgi:hypothetical protein
VPIDVCCDVEDIKMIEGLSSWAVGVPECVLNKICKHLFFFFLKHSTKRDLGFPLSHSHATSTERRAAGWRRTTNGPGSPRGAGSQVTSLARTLLSTRPLLHSRSHRSLRDSTTATDGTRSIPRPPPPVLSLDRETSILPPRLSVPSIAMDLPNGRGVAGEEETTRVANHHQQEDEDQGLVSSLLTKVRALASSDWIARAMVLIAASMD